MSAVFESAHFRVCIHPQHRDLEMFVSTVRSRAEGLASRWALIKTLLDVGCDSISRRHPPAGSTEKQPHTSNETTYSRRKNFMHCVTPPRSKGGSPIQITASSQSSSLSAQFHMFSFRDSVLFLLVRFHAVASHLKHCRRPSCCSAFASKITSASVLMANHHLTLPFNSGHHQRHHRDTSNTIRTPLRHPTGHLTGHQRATAEHPSRGTFVLISLQQRRDHCSRPPSQLRLACSHRRTKRKDFRVGGSAPLRSHTPNLRFLSIHSSASRGGDLSCWPLVT